MFESLKLAFGFDISEDSRESHAPVFYENDQSFLLDCQMLARLMTIFAKNKTIENIASQASFAQVSPYKVTEFGHIQTAVVTVNIGNNQVALINFEQENTMYSSGRSHGSSREIGIRVSFFDMSAEEYSSSYDYISIMGSGQLSKIVEALDHTFSQAPGENLNELLESGSDRRKISKEKYFIKLIEEVVNSGHKAFELQLSGDRGYSKDPRWRELHMRQDNRPPLILPEGVMAHIKQDNSELADRLAKAYHAMPSYPYGRKNKGRLIRETHGGSYLCPGSSEPF